MELKEYWQIIKKDGKLLLGIIILFIATSVVYFVMRPVSYSVSLGLNITRNGAQETQDYRYDDFYRLQADEKFAETVVEWLKNPRIAMDILTKAGLETRNLSLRQLSKAFNPEKLSSQIIAVSFSAKNEKMAENTSNAVSEIIAKNVDMLNENQRENTWFRVVSQEPVIIRNEGNFWTMFIFPFFLGIFVGLWVVMIRRYLK